MYFIFDFTYDEYRASHAYLRNIDYASDMHVFAFALLVWLWRLLPVSIDNYGAYLVIYRQMWCRVV